jgi:outer membrane protein assembly factor BamA
VDQGLGIGSASPFFNKHLATFTRFIKLRGPKPGSTSPPMVAVAHARYGGCVGDMASYDYFTLGGPHSIRGYSIGEVAAARRFVEMSAELRVPVLGQHVYGFYEFGSDLGSSKELRGNPTEYFRRAGAGVSYGGGIKLGPVRCEYATDCNAGKGNYFLRFGERY